MDITHLHSTRFLPVKLALVLLLVLGGCAGTPEEPDDVEEPEVVTTPVETPEAPAPQAVELKPNYPEKYIVVKGDTLWDISSRFLRDPWKWPSLWHYNPHIANPHLIYPGDILNIVFVNGQPVLQVTRDGQVFGPGPEAGTKEEGRPRISSIPSEALKSGKYPTVKLKPRIREEGLEEAIPTIPMEAIKPFLNRPRIVAEDELERAPYIVALGDKHVMSGEGYKIYVRNLDKNDIRGDYVIVREGEAYRDPDTKDILGYEAKYLGEARLTNYGDPATMGITDSAREIMAGDRLIPKGDEFNQFTYTPRAPDRKVIGKIISVMEGVTMVGQYRVVVLNLGRQDDIDPGHVLAVYQSGVEVKDPVKNRTVTLPDEHIGTLMIFRTFDRVSYALVMETTKPIRLYDTVATP